MIKFRRLPASLTKSRRSAAQILAYLLALPLIAVLSYWIIAPDIAITPDHPGGTYLEIAFWLTAIGSAFLSFIMMEVLFRSQETRNLASFPIPPLSMFVFQIGRVFKAILLTTVPIICFWLPHCTVFAGAAFSASECLRMTLCILIWPIGLSICAVVSSAILLYTGHHATDGEATPQSAAMAFSAAPAIALATSLVLTLLLKLLAEALIKPGFFNAALTAFLITFIAFIAALLYSALMYHRHYYGILAGFSDTDLIVLNANYAFLDDTEARQLRNKHSISGLISHALCIQYKRRHATTTLFIITFAILLCATLWAMPEYLHTIWLPGVALAPFLFLSKPWLSLHGPDLDPAPLGVFAASPGAIHRATSKAVITIAAPQVLILSAALFLPALILGEWISGIIVAAEVLVLSGISTILLTLASEKDTKTASILTYSIALILTISAFIF